MPTSQLLDYLQEEPFPTKLAMVRFFAECVHHSWPERSQDPPHNLSPAEADKQMMSTLEKEIQQMEITVQNVYNSVQLIICARRHRFNSLLPVNKIPPEVLCQIFALADDGNVRHRFNLAQTCSSWRHLLLRYPNLWASIDLSSVTLSHNVRCIIKRANGLPLQLSYFDWHALNEDKADCIASLMQNVESLKLRVTTRYVKHSGTWLAQLYAPKLQWLDLTLSGGIAIFPRLFGNKRPSLRELTLTNCRLAWAPGLYSGITKLKIQSHYVMQSTDTSDRDIRQVFRDCPNLVELELVNCGPVYDPSITGLPDVLPLPQLHLLHLQLHVAEVIAILDCILPPPTVHITLHCNTSSPIAPLLHSNNLSVISKLRSLEVDGTGCTVTGFADLEGRVESFALNLYGEHAGAVFDPLVRALGGVYPLPNLRRLRALTLASERLEELLRTAPALTHLELVCDAHTLEMLAEQLMEKNPQMLQRLEALALEDVQLDGDALLDITAILQYAPHIKFLCLCRCDTALSKDEVIALFKDDVDMVKCTNDSFDGYDLTDDYPDEIVQQHSHDA